VRGLQSCEDVDVIGDATDALRDGFHFAEDAAEVGVEAFASTRDDERAAFLGGEDEMVVQAEMRGGHGAILPAPRPGRMSFFCRYSGGVASLRHRLISPNASGVRSRPIRCACRVCSGSRRCSLAWLARPPATFRCSFGTFRQRRICLPIADGRGFTAAVMKASLRLNLLRIAVMSHPGDGHAPRGRCGM
jgi:hypothetical protein